MTKIQLSKDEERIGKALVEYLKIGMRWCRLERILRMSKRELENILSRYKAIHCNDNKK